MHNQDLFYCDNLSIGYDNKPILSPINFCIEIKDYLVILGENGAGKSTLIKTLLGLIKPISGSVVLSSQLDKTSIGYLPQQNVSQKDFPASVEEVVLSGFLAHSGFRIFYTKKEREKAFENIKKMGLDGLEKKSFSELSGGQRQKVLLARALCAAKNVLLLDEPVSSLDPRSTDEMYQIITKLNNANMAIIMVSHDIKSLEYANKVLHLGQNIFFGTKEDYLKTNLSHTFLGSRQRNVE